MFEATLISSYPQYDLESLSPLYNTAGLITAH